MRFCLILITALLLAGCSHHKAPPPNARLSDSITVIAGLNDQLQSWHGTPYRYGGMTRRGVDCSGFVVVTMRDRFDLQLPRETKQQASIGTQIDKDELLPGDLVFFKTGSGQNGLHVGIYDTNNQFIHASTSKGVMRSSLDNVYWQSMSHLDEVIARVDAAIEESVIAHMNELLIALSDDAELSREDRYTQQQRLRTAIAHHGRKHKEDMEARHEQLTKGGTIL